MIADKIENANFYTHLSPAIAEAFQILKKSDFSDTPDGRYEIDGDRIYYILQRYQTKPFEQGKLETHRKYIDIQFVAAGCETIGYAPADGLKIADAYNSEKDIAFYHTPADTTQLKLEAGMFCIFFPHDAHLPCRHTDKPSDVTKIVIKVKVNDD